MSQLRNLRVSAPQLRPSSSGVGQFLGSTLVGSTESAFTVLLSDADSEWYPRRAARPT